MKYLASRKLNPPKTGTMCKREQATEDLFGGWNFVIDSKNIYIYIVYHFAGKLTSQN